MEGRHIGILSRFDFDLCVVILRQPTKFRLNQTILNQTIAGGVMMSLSYRVLKMAVIESESYFCV